MWGWTELWGERGSLRGLGIFGFYSERDGSHGRVLSGEGGVVYVEMVTLTTRVAIENPCGWLLCRSRGAPPRRWETQKT